MKRAFTRLAQGCAEATGSYWAFLLAFGTVLGWAIGGLWVGYGTDYQIWINTGTTVVTFLMVFLIQNAQNRNDAALHAKLGEIIKALPQADNTVINAENLSEDQLAAMIEELRTIARGRGATK